MERVLVISDIHGCYDEFCELIHKVKYNPDEDKLILLGDYCDRGSRSKDVIQLVLDMVNEHNVIAIRGNHDQMFIDWLSSDSYNAAQLFMYNGGMQTLESYCGLDWFEEGLDLDGAKDFILTHYKHHVDFLSSLPYYHETQDQIYVHAGINAFYEDWRETPKEDMIWIRDMFINNQTQTDKTVIFGHTPCVHLHDSADVWMGEDKIGIDGGCCFGKQLNCLEMSDEGYNTYFVESKNK